jgi:hypothetical protein
VPSAPEQPPGNPLDALSPLGATTAFVPALLASGDATAVVPAIADAQAWWP